jgi:hypothetical protein
MSIIRVKPFGSVKNMNILEFGKLNIVYSYGVPVAVETENHIFRTKKKFSKTTSKHINSFLKSANNKPVFDVSQEEIENFVKIKD